MIRNQPFHVHIFVAQETPFRLILAYKLLNFFSLISFAMRDNGDDLFGEPLDRVDRHAPSRIPSSLPSTSLSTHLPSSTSTTTLATLTSLASPSPLDAFIRSVHVALNSGLSPDTLVANIHLIVQERADVQASLPVSLDEFFSQ